MSKCPRCEKSKRMLEGRRAWNFSEDGMYGEDLWICDKCYDSLRKFYDKWWRGEK